MATSKISVCADGAPYESLRFCVGTKVLPGIRQHVYVIRKADIALWPTLPENTDEGVSFAKLGSYQGDFTLAADKKWQRVDLTYNKGNIECESQGDRPSRTFLNKLTVYYPGTSAQAAGFCRMAVDDDLVWLVPQRDGQYRVLGSEQFEVDVQPKMSTGEGTSTNGGTELAIEATDIVPAPFYPGKIETATDGDISGATGKPLTA